MQKKDIINVPSTPGVYIFYNHKKPIYIGKATNIKVRIFSHFTNAKLDSKEYLITTQATHIKYLKTDSDFRALLLEANLINQYKPQYNIRGRDDKSNLFLEITLGDRFPKVFATRRTNLQKKSIFFGPFSSQRVVLEVINYLRNIIPFCTQKTISKNPCFYSKINLCSPCPNKILSIKNRQEQNKFENNYLININQIIKILQGNTKAVLLGLYKKLDQIKKTEEYEQCIKLRDQIYRFEYLIYEKTFLYEEPFTLHNNQKALLNLQNFLNNYFPNIKTLYRIEGIDISNFQEKETVGSLVTFIKGIPSKAEYKRFKITVKTKSDLERVRNVIKRRFLNNWPKPDLLIIDGGKQQIKATDQVLKKMKIDLPLIGVVKGPDRIVLGSNLSVIRLPLNHLGFNLVKAIRDEAHRFAKKYHLVLRSKNFKI